MSGEPARISEAVRRQFQPGGALEIMGRSEAAEALGVQRSNLTALKGWPAPLFQLKSGSSWLASDVRAFAQHRARSEARQEGRIAVTEDQRRYLQAFDRHLRAGDDETRDWIDRLISNMARV